MPRLDLEFSRGAALQQVSGFTFVDDATPLGIDDTTGSTGAMTVTLAAGQMRPADAKSLRGQMVTISSTGDDRRTIGKVTHVSGTLDSIGLDIDSISLRLAVKRNAKPFIGRLEDGIIYWAGLCKVDPSSVQVDDAIAGQQIALVGFRDNVWQRIKQLCAAVEIEVVIQDNAIVVRPPRALVVDAARVSAKSWDVDDTSLAQIIEVAYYDPRSVVSGDYSPDYSRSNVSADAADDPDGGLVTANRAANQLPPGYTKRTVNYPG
jgi:hypothetical protein